MWIGLCAVVDMRLMDNQKATEPESDKVTLVEAEFCRSGLYERMER